MSLIGCVTLPNEVINKRYANIELSQEETEMFNNPPQIGASLLENILRLESVAAVIRKQLQEFSTYDPDVPAHEEINIGAQVIKAVFDYDLLLSQGLDHLDAIRHLKHQQNVYNPEVVSKLSQRKASDELTRVVSLRVQDLAMGMHVEENIMAKN